MSFTEGILFVFVCVVFVLFCFFMYFLGVAFLTWSLRDFGWSAGRVVVVKNECCKDQMKPRENETLTRFSRPNQLIVFI